jgi:hypothetical protein
VIERAATDAREIGIPSGFFGTLTEIPWNAFNLHFRIALIWKYSSAFGAAAALT